MARQIVVDIVGNADDFRRASRGATEAAGDVNRGLKGAAVAGAAAGLAISGAAMAASAIIGVLGDASAAAKEDQASQDQLALALKNTGREQQLNVEQIEKVISANQAKGVSDSDQRAGISAFLDLTKSATDAMALNNAAVELAAAKGIDYAAAQKIIISAASGRTAALAKAGVAVDKDASATDVARAVTDKFGGSLDRVAQTQGGRSKIASEKMGEAMERVGTIVNKVAAVALPILADVLTFLVDKVIPPVASALEAIIPIVVRVGRTFATVFTAIASVVRTTFDIVTGAIRFGINGVIGIVNGIIGAINAIQVHVHVGPVNLDWDGLNIGKLPTLHSGGIVPGVPGSEVLTILQAGERVTPAGAGAAGGSSLTINVQALDPAAAATAVIRAIDEWERANGRRFARATA